MLIQTLIDRIARLCTRRVQSPDSNLALDEGQPSASSEGTDIPLAAESAKHAHRSPYDIPGPFRLL